MFFLLNLWKQRSTNRYSISEVFKLCVAVSKDFESIIQGRCRSKKKNNIIMMWNRKLKQECYYANSYINDILFVFL